MKFFGIFLLTLVSFNVCFGSLTLRLTNVCSKTYYNFTKPPLVSNIIRVNECLPSNHELISLNGKYRLVMEDDGNLVIFEAVKPIWKTHSHRSDADRFCLQDNQWTLCRGRQTIVLYCQQMDQIAYAILQDDGNFVAYSAAGVAVWSTDTAKF